MKENMLAVLMYLFENHMGNAFIVDKDQNLLIEELESAGFSMSEINLALSWLEELNELDHKGHYLAVSKTAATRVYAREEHAKLGVQGCNFIMYLEKLGVLNALTREMIIDRVMALDSYEIDMGRLKWVILIVLFNHPGQEAQLAWMEDYVLNNREVNHLH